MKIMSIAYALPSRLVTNDEIIQEVLAKNSEHLENRDRGLIESMIRRFFKMSGTETRFHRSNGEKAIDFALKAGRDAIQKAGIGPGDIDLLIYAGVGRGWVEPATANLFQSELGLTSATCFDVLDACASWIRSLSIARSFLSQKVYKRIMIINCEFNFKEYANFEIRDAKDLENSFSAFTIGEAATATIVTSNGDYDDSNFTFKTWGEKHGLCKIPLPNASDFNPNGERLKPMSFFTAPAELLSFTVRKLVSHFKETQEIAEKVHDIIIGHAVSVATTSRVIRILGLNPESVFETHNRFGNTVSASLPLALAVADEEGRLQRGNRVLLMMGSAGVTTALASFEY